MQAERPAPARGGRFFINSEGLGSYHPDAAGYRAYVKAIFAAIRRFGSTEMHRASLA